MSVFLPPNEESFSVNIVGDRSQKLFQGDFTIKPRLNCGELVTIEANADRLGANSPTISPGYKAFMRSLAELEIQVLEGPRWWVASRNGLGLEDPNLVAEISMLTNKAVNEHFEKIAAAAEQVEKATKAKESETKKEPAEQKAGG
jgi:hypothetical protein